MIELLKKKERKKVLLELEVDLLAKIDAIKMDIGVSRREVIEHAIKYYLSQKDKGE